MALNDDIKTFAARIQYRLIELSGTRLDMEREGKKGHKSYSRNLYDCKKLWSVLRIVFSPTYSIVDEDDAQVYNFLDWTEEKIYIFIDRVTYLYRLNIVPYSMISGIDYTIVTGETVLVSGALPDGGAPSWIIAQDASGTAVWIEFPTIFQAPTELI
ncbi:hypothetical protein LCGC14_0245340 [marine sediment metagenome]|uniref:Uncharacterized protein n=1 Tax=marine sediment metagenome TaxID=412755 RepID=A0A0F9XAF3_9ZZZZ